MMTEFAQGLNVGFACSAIMAVVFWFGYWCGKTFGR